MAIIGNIHRVGDYKVLFLIDPRRYRATIWAPHAWNADEEKAVYSIHVRTMVDKDEAALRRRVQQWIDDNPLTHEKWLHCNKRQLERNRKRWKAMNASAEEALKR